MDTTLQTVCPHCGQTVSIDYEHMKSHYASELGKLSVKKRPDYKEKLRNASRVRWQNYKHPKQDALLELAQREDLSKLNMAQIAQRLEIGGKHPELVVKRLVVKLQEEGLLEPGIGKAYNRVSRELVALSKSTDLSQLSYAEIADRINLTGKWRAQNVAMHLRRLEKKGLVKRVS